MQHHLIFYDDATALIERVADFARDGLAAGELVMIVATADHTAAITACLAAGGFDVDKARAFGRLLTLDAADTLAAFCTDGRIDTARFDAVVGGLVSGALARGRPVRVFGEMVALLWDAGHPETAVELEGLWERLGARAPFDLLCAYPADVLVCGDAYELVNSVCDSHSQVVLGSKESHPTRLRAYPGELSSVRAARHFVANLAGVDDAALIASELSANAVYHAKSSFVVEVARLDGSVRIGVRDGYHRRPKLNVADDHSGSGRGIAMIDALSDRWGVEPHARGKTVWAELAL